MNTASSKRMGWVSAICTPAIKLESVGLAAMPSTRPARPAEASMLAPTARMEGMVISMMEPVTMTTTTETTRLKTRTWVSILRAARLSLTSKR